MKRNQYLDDMAKFVGLFVMFVIGAALLIGLVYGLLGYFDDNGRRVLATGLIFAVLGAFLLGLQVGKAHMKGVERGLDLKLGGRERAQQITRPTAAQPSPAVRFDDLLPKVQPGAIIVQRRDDDTTPIEL
jgi:hypothetical protein